MTKSAYGIAIALTALTFSGCKCKTDSGVGNVQGKIGVVYDEGGVRITQDNGTYDFDKVGMGVKKTLKMTITNLGNGPITLESLEKTEGDAVQIGGQGDAQPVFLVDFVGTTNVSPGQTVDFDVTFDSPLEADQSIKTKDHLSQLLLRATNASVETAQITLKGTSVSGACDLPRTIDFGAVATGDAFNKTVTIENFSPIDTTATVGDITSNSGDDKNFEFAPDSERGQFSLAAGKKKDVIFVFKPTEIKDYLALVKMRAAEACPEVTVTLIGSGVDSVLTWAPNPVDFGYVTPGLQVSADVTFSNQGLAPITLTGMKTMAGAVASNEYKLVGPDTIVVPAAVRMEQPDGSRVLNPGTAIVTMTFKPQILGKRDAALVAATTLGKQPNISVPLKGYGGGPDIDVRPNPVLNFARVPFFSTAATPYFVTRKVTVQNVGTKPTTPDPKANLRLGKLNAGMPATSGPYWEVHAKAGTAAQDSEICVGEVDPGTGACTNSVSNYDPSIGIVAGGSASLLDIPVRITPADAGGNKEWELSIFSNDPDEAVFKISIKAEAVVLPPCNYSTSPTNLNFGLVTPPSYRDLTFAIHNNGANAGEICLLNSLDMKIGSNQIYSLPAGPLENKELMPGETVNVLVRAWPQGSVTSTVQNAMGGVLFNISSPTKPQTEVTLNASIATSCLTIAPDSLDFGTVKKDCFSSRREFAIYNTCSSAVTVNSFGMVAGAGQPNGGPNCSTPGGCPEFLVDGTPGFSPGSTIPAGSSMPVKFALKYRPIDYGHDNGAYLIKVTQNSQVVDYIITLQGTGDTQGLNTDVFRQDTKPKADILLVIDDSCSMSDKQAALAANFSSFIKYATTAGVDYQIGVITTDMADQGKLIGDANNPKILKPTTPNVENLFKLKVNVGVNGGTECMAGPSTMALTAPVITAENAGFLRVDAVLAVVVISDAGDQSPQAATIYENQLRNVKGAQRASQFSYNVIGPFAPTPAPGCSYDDYTDVSKHQYLVSRFNGVKEEICAPNWSTSLESVGKNAFGYRTNFFLTAEPQGGTVQVAIDGITLDPVDGRGAPVWNYDATSNSVNFQPLFVPEPGKTLTITYTVQCRTM